MVLGSLASSHNTAPATGLVRAGLQAMSWSLLLAWVSPSWTGRMGGKPLVVGLPKASTVMRMGCWPKGTPAIAEPGWREKASAATCPMTMKELLLAGEALPTRAEAVKVFGPAWSTLKSLKWAIP